MRATFAILLGCLLVWAQAMAGVAPLAPRQAAVCCGCACGTGGCCGAPAPSRAPAPPTVAARISPASQTQIQAPSVSVARLTPVIALPAISLRPVFQRAPALPFYERDCALLL
jgi:hypothetical protein